MRKYAFILFVIFALFYSSFSFARSVNRNILAILDPTEITQNADNSVSSYLQFPLEHLGFKVSYYTLSDKFPSDKEMEKYTAIVTWFNDNKMKNARDYVTWITQQLTKGKKLLVFDEFGFHLDENLKVLTEIELAPFFSAFQVSYDEKEHINSPLLIEIIKKDSEIVEFERQIKNDLTNFTKINVLDENAEVFLQLKRKDKKDMTFDAVFTHSKGGYVASEYTHYLNPIDYQSRWRLNPFKFLAKALNADFPKPDVSTINGMRLFYTHVDGDGVRNYSRAYETTFPGDLLYSKFLTKYNIPFSISAVLADIFLADKANQEIIINIFKKIFELPNVELASHGWSHPLVWKKEGRKMAYKIPNFTYSPESEIAEAVDYMNRELAPKGKTVKTFFWTGDCEPDYEALKKTYDLGLYNINGGDTRFDTKNPSYTYIAPLYRQVGDLKQFYASNSNENIYTDGWAGPLYGFHNVIQTFERTETPIRVRPIDVYYHFNSMEYKQSIKALKEVYDWVMKQEVAPVFVTEYLSIVKGFLSTIIYKLGEQHWLIQNNEALRTMRFDNFSGHVNLIESKGVMGYYPYQKSLYVHLDNGKQSEIILTDEEQSQPYLIKANGLIKDWQVTKDKISFKIKVMNTISLQFANMGKEQTHHITVKDMTETVKSNDMKSFNFFKVLSQNSFVWIPISVTI
jgi:polysaccharide biosynthesis protein PelA